jgi:hypothetical protein
VLACDVVKQWLAERKEGVDSGSGLLHPVERQLPETPCEQRMKFSCAGQLPAERVQPRCHSCASGTLLLDAVLQQRTALRALSRDEMLAGAKDMVLGICAWRRTEQGLSAMLKGVSTCWLLESAAPSNFHNAPQGQLAVPHARCVKRCCASP